MENIPKTSPKGLGQGATRLFAILGFIAVLGIGMWGSVQVARAVPGTLSNIAAAIVSLTSIFVPAGETISLSAPTLDVNSGESFVMTWTHAKKSVDGSYTFRYECADGVHFTSPSATGNNDTVFCNVPFNFLNTNNSITLTAISEKNRYADVTVFIDFTPNGANKATVTGKTTFTISNENLGTSPSTTATTTVPSTPSTPAKPTTPVTTTPHNNPGTPTSQTYPITTTTGPAASDPNGYVDLAANFIEVGTVDKTTGAFTASSTPSRSQRIAIRFSVQNIGTKTSPQFDFNAVLPTIPSSIFSSPMQKELAPGDRIEFTIGFDSFNPDQPDGVFTVNIDPSGRFNERDKNNNIAHYTIHTVK